MGRRMFSGAEKLLFEKAAKHRKQQTFAEEILWNYLRTKPFGFKFRRQHPFSSYILDFYCHSIKLVIEVDGSIHDLEEVKQNDQLRQKQLEQEGLTFLRFSNDHLRLKSEEVIQQIETYLKENSVQNKDSST
jgi:cyclase